MPEDDGRRKKVGQWEYCLICDRLTKPHLRVIGLLSGKIGAVDQGECWMIYLRVKGKLRPYSRRY